MTFEPFHFRIGEMACTSLPDAIETLAEADVQSMFGDVAERVLPAFRAYPGPLTFCRNILLVETGGQRVLIDTGMGQADPNDVGHLLERLQAENITPESINTVVITHYHPDHIGGLVDQAGQPTFAKARLVVPRQEHGYWMQAEVLAGLEPADAEAFRRTFAAYGERLTQLDDATEIAPGMHYVPAVGHSPGHRAVELESGGARLLHIVDAIHTPIQLNALDAAPFDWQAPEVAAATRQALAARAEAEHLLVMAYHFPFPGVGYIRRQGGQLVWEPYAGAAQ